MRGPKPHYPIILSETKAKELRQQINAPKTAQGKAKRASIILMAHEQPEKSNQEIAKIVGCSDRLERKRQHWLVACPGSKKKP